MLHNISVSNKQAALNASLTDLSWHIKTQSVALPGLGRQLHSNASPTANTLTVNGSVVLSPSSKPGTAVAGQLYYNQALNRMQYYDGTGFVTLQGGVTTTNVYNSSTTLGGNTFVTNNGGASIKGTPGTLALFGSNGSTLADSLINQSGATLNVGTSTSTTNLQGGIGGVAISTGATTGSSGNINIQSGGSSTTASGNVTIDTGTGFVSGTVITDMTFEDGTDEMDPWSGPPTVTQDCTVAHSGSCSLAVNGPAFWDILQNVNYSEVPVTAGHHYVITAWVRGATGSTTIAGRLIWSGGTFNSSYLAFPNTTDTTSGWTEMTAIGIAPAGATFGTFTFGGVGASNSNGVQYFDDITVTDISSGSASSELDLGSTNAQVVNIGNMNETEATTIEGGSGIELNSGAANINIDGGAIAVNGTGASTFGTDSGSLTLGAGGGTGGGVIVGTQTASTTAFQVQGTNADLLTVDSADDAVSFGTGVGSTVGYTDIGTTTGGSGVDTMSAQKITTTTAPVGQTTVDLTAITAYIGADGIEAAPNNQYQFAIYADNGSGAPGAYVASTEVGTLGSFAGWYTLPITVALTPSTTYWLVYWQNGITGSENGYSVTPGVSGAVNETGTSTWGIGPDNGMPASFPTGGSSTNDAASIYATYTGGGPALTLNAAGTLTQNGAAIFQDSINSPTALMIQNSTGSSLFTADTADMTITIGGSLTVSGSITVDGHVVTGGSTPGIAAGAAACTSPTVSISGDDTSGNITVTTGTGCTSGGILATVTFANAFGTPPHITLTPDSSSAQTLGDYVNGSTLSTSAFSIGSNSTPSNSTAYEWNYWVAQ